MRHSTAITTIAPLTFCVAFLALLLPVTPAQSQVPSAAGPGNFLDVDGSKIYYEECGAGPEAVVLIHDGIAHSVVWDAVWPAFCKQFHTIRYDRRGYGRSPATTQLRNRRPAGAFAPPASEACNACRQLAWRRAFHRLHA